MLCFLLVSLYASTGKPSKGTCAKPLIIVSQYSTGPEHNMGCKYKFECDLFVSFIGTFILSDVDNLLLRLISEEHRQSMVDSTRKLMINSLTDV